MPCCSQTSTWACCIACHLLTTRLPTHRVLSGRMVTRDRVDLPPLSPSAPLSSGTARQELRARVPALALAPVGSSPTRRRCPPPQGSPVTVASDPLPSTSRVSSWTAERGTSGGSLQANEVDEVNEPSLNEVADVI